MTPTAQRARLGFACAAFGALSLLALAFTWLSAHGPAPFAMNGRIWSRIFYAQFLALIAVGYGLVLADAARTRVFHGGPMLDFTIGLGLFALASSFGRAWVPGALLIIFGLRMATGRALLA